MSTSPISPPELRKYPRTQHVEGSRLQKGDEDLHAVAWSELADQHLVIEEKMDGANAGLSFDDSGTLWLQSRGHYLMGGGREVHFDLFKRWAHAHQDTLWRILGARYTVYGEWLFAKHTVFYDLLPHYFLEFDVLDRMTGEFLDTERRASLLADAPIVSVAVLFSARAPKYQQALELVGPSGFKSSAWTVQLERIVEERALDLQTVRDQTDPSDEMEGLYIKAEAEGRVIGRYKYVRASFLQAVVESGSHWLSRPIVPNSLAEGVDIFEQ